MKRTRKYVLLIAILLGLFLCGCHSAAPAETTASPASPPVVLTMEPDPWLMNFPGTQWGMTPDEVIAALSLEDGSYELAEEGNQIRVRMTLFGVENAYVGFDFDDQNGDGAFTLFAVTAYWRSKL